MLTVNTINRQIKCSHNTPESALNGCKYIQMRHLQTKNRTLLYAKQLPCFTIDQLLNRAQQRAFKSVNPVEFE